MSEGHKIFAENSETATMTKEKRKEISPANIFKKIFSAQAQSQTIIS